MNQKANPLFNFLTLVFLILTGIAFFLFYNITTDRLEPPVFKPDPTGIIPTEIVVLSPTPLPSWTPSNTPRPTRTFTPTNTLIPTITNTPTITQIPTLTPTFPPTNTFTPSPTNTLIPPTATPTKTLTVTPSITPTFTSTPTYSAATYPFMIQPTTPILRDNIANTAGCNWQGIAGQVTTEQSAPITGIQVRVTGDNFAETFTLSGTNTFYGPSGWEVVLGNQPNNERYYVELWANGIQVSARTEIIFPNSCQHNLAMINFIQTRQF